MKLYIGTKMVIGKPMNRAEYNDYRGWQLPDNENGEDKGFLVEYVDGGPSNDPRHAGYISWSPRDVFKRAYHPVDVGLTFGDALVALKNGKSVRRLGWNGKGMFIYRVPPAEYPAQTGVAKSYWGKDAFVPYDAYFALKNAQETVSVWQPSTSDCLAEDWEIIE